MPGCRSAASAIQAEAASFELGAEGGRVGDPLARRGGAAGRLEADRAHRTGWPGAPRPSRRGPPSAVSGSLRPSSSQEAPGPIRAAASGFRASAEGSSRARARRCAASTSSRARRKRRQAGRWLATAMRANRPARAPPSIPPASRHHRHPGSGYHALGRRAARREDLTGEGDAPGRSAGRWRSRPSARRTRAACSRSSSATTSTSPSSASWPTCARRPTRCSSSRPSPAGRAAGRGGWSASARRCAARCRRCRVPSSSSPATPWWSRPGRATGLLQRAFFLLMLRTRLRHPLAAGLLDAHQQGLQDLPADDAPLPARLPAPRRPHAAGSCSGPWRPTTPPATPAPTTRRAASSTSARATGRCAAGWPSHRREALADPGVGFFLARNPGWREGQELACIAEIRWRDFARHALAAFLPRRRRAGRSGRSGAGGRRWRAEAPGGRGGRGQRRGG